MTDKDDKCDLCRGTGVVGPQSCPFCNGTGEWNQSAQSYVNNHICQCITWDRKFCPICMKSCHHDTPLGPKQKIDPGYGGKGMQLGHTPDEFGYHEEIVV